MKNKLAIPERYEVWQQDLTKDYLCLTPMGYVRTQSEARNMLKVFNACDKKPLKVEFIRISFLVPSYEMLIKGGVT